MQNAIDPHVRGGVDEGPRGALEKRVVGGAGEVEAELGHVGLVVDFGVWGLFSLVWVGERRGEGRGRGDVQGMKRMMRVVRRASRRRRMVRRVGVVGRWWVGRVRRREGDEVGEGIVGEGGFGGGVEIVV